MINGRTGVAMRELLLKIRALLLRFGAADERAAATAVTLGLLEALSRSARRRRATASRPRTPCWRQARPMRCKGAARTR